MQRQRLSVNQEPRRMPAAAVVLLTALATAGIVLLVAIGRPLFDSAPIVSAEISPQRIAAEYSVSPVSATYPPELVEMARAVSTALAPTVEPAPRPTYAALPTPAPILCGTWLEDGTTCTMPKAPLPTPTPLSECPVAESEECIWRNVPQAVFAGLR